MFADLIEKRSKGEIEIQRFPAQQLVKNKETFPAMRTGMVDLGYVFAGHHAGETPVVADATFVPYGWKWENNEAVWIDSKLPKIINERMKPHNVRWLWPIVTHWPEWYFISLRISHYGATKKVVLSAERFPRK